MKYDFTSIIDRHGKDAMAVDALYPGVPFGPPGSHQGGLRPHPYVGGGHELRHRPHDH